MHKLLPTYEVDALVDAEFAEGLNVKHIEVIELDVEHINAEAYASLPSARCIVLCLLAACAAGYGVGILVTLI